MAPYIDIRDLSVSYENTLALERFSLCAERNDRVVVVGPSGSGKTTLLLALCGLVKHQSGVILLGGRQIESLSPGARRIAMVFQDGALFPHFTARRNIEMPLKAAGLPREEREARIRAIARLMGILPLLDRRPGAMSGGERQRVAIARALVREPNLYVLDEPFASLDPTLRHRMAQEVLDIHARVGVPFIHVTHDQAEALALGTLIVVLHQGRIRQIGTPSDIYDAPADTFVAEFVGYPPMNLILRRDLPENFLSSAVVPATPLGHREVIVGFRPEDIHIEPEGPATLLSRQVQGHEQVLVFQIEGIRVTARLKRDKPLDADSYRLSLEHGRVHLFDADSGRRLP